jgi:hypothetical protein
LEVCPFQPTRRRRPDSHPGSLRDGAQTHLSVNDRPEGQPVACPIRRTAQGRGRIDRKASRHERRSTPTPAVYRTSVPVREATGAGRLAPPAGGNRPRTARSARRSSLSRSSLGCTEVQPREPKHSAIRRLCVPYPAWKNSIAPAIRKLSSGKNFCE